LQEESFFFIYLSSYVLRLSVDFKGSLKHAFINDIILKQEVDIDNQTNIVENNHHRIKYIVKRRGILIKESMNI
jgi:hypothetical protein